MAKYYLTAEHEGTTQVIRIDAVDDASAMLQGIDEVMTRAYPNVDLWAKGAITLTNSNGDVVQSMAAK